MTRKWILPYYLNSEENRGARGTKEAALNSYGRVIGRVIRSPIPPSFRPDETDMNRELSQ